MLCHRLEEKEERYLLVVPFSTDSDCLLELTIAIGSLYFGKPQEVVGAYAQWC